MQSTSRGVSFAMLVVLLLGAASVGGVIGGLAYSFADNGYLHSSGTVVRIGANFSQIDDRPFCV